MGRRAVEFRAAKSPEGASLDLYSVCRKETDSVFGWDSQERHSGFLNWLEGVLSPAFGLLWDGV